MAGTFEDFFREHYVSVQAGVRAAGVSSSAATDATQEAFVRAYPRWWRIKRFRNPAAWVQRVAINAGRDLDRTDNRQARYLNDVLVSAPHDASSLFDDNWLDDPEKPGFDGAEGAVAALPNQQEAVVRAYYADGLSTGETAEQLGVTPGAVRFHLSQARDSLRSSLTSPTGQEA